MISAYRNAHPTTIIFIIFWDFLMFYQIFLSPQVKRCAIITYIHNIHELLQQLPYDLRLLEIRKHHKMHPASPLPRHIPQNSGYSKSDHHHGVTIATTTQPPPTKSELRFRASSNRARSMLETPDCENLWQWSRLEIRLNVFYRSTIPQKQFIM